MAFDTFHTHAHSLARTPFPALPVPQLNSKEYNTANAALNLFYTGPEFFTRFPNEESLTVVSCPQCRSNVHQHAYVQHVGT